MKVTQSRLTLCNSMDYIVHEILQAGILEWVAFPFSRGSSQPRDGTQVSCTAGGHAVSPALILLVSQGQNITEPHQLKTLFTYLKKMSHFLFSFNNPPPRLLLVWNAFHTFQPGNLLDMLASLSLSHLKCATSNIAYGLIRTKYRSFTHS